MSLGPSSPLLAHQGFFVFRTPALPFADVFGAIADSDSRITRERMLDLLDRSEIREALFLASPDLWDAIDHWRKDPLSDKGARAEKSLAKYLSRMAFRSTPFGLFAGCSIGRMGKETAISFSKREDYRRYTRFDNDYLTSLCEVITKDPKLRKGLVVYPNSSLYQTAGKLRYAESRSPEKNRTYHLVAVDDSQYLRDTLARADGGADPESLAQALVDDEITLEEGRAFIEELIDNQVLVVDLEPRVTGTEPVLEILNQLRSHPHLHPIADPLAAAHLALKNLDTQGLGAEPKDYLPIAEALGALPSKVELSRLFQVDMNKPAPEAVLGEAVIREINHAAEVLHRLSSNRSENPLSKFREAFGRRFEGREVPLAEVLDEEIGIGLGAPINGKGASPLLEGLLFAEFGTEEAVSPRGALDRYLMAKVQKAATDGKRVVDLDPGGLNSIFDKPNPRLLPEAMSFMGVIASKSTEATAQGDFQLIVRGFSGPSGATLLGRFCHTDQDLLSGVHAHIAAEEAHRPDAIYAEVVHLPEGRIGNIVQRPILRNYEIPYLGRSGVPEEYQIPISDLLVSLVGERVVLRSKSLGKEVLPRLSSAHNYSSRSLVVYRFLCLLQSQQLAGPLTWDWGVLEGMPFLPRVTCGRLILSRARWRFSKREIEHLFDANADPMNAIRNWQTTQNLPRFVLLQDGDNELPVDLDARLSVDMFLDLISKRTSFSLVEMCPMPDLFCATGPEGVFSHELVVPLTRVKQSGHEPAASVGQKTSVISSSFIPGSEWMYVKLYTGSTTADRLIRDVITPLVEEFTSAGYLDRWFFIRYGDPDWHLRLRFHGEPNALRTQLWARLNEALFPLLADGSLWRIQLDTYEREVERYGGPVGIQLCEAWFHRDSQMASALLALMPGDAGMDVRWRVSLRCIDGILNGLGFELDDKARLLSRLRMGFGEEFRAEGMLEKAMGVRFRKERVSLTRLIEQTPGLVDYPEVEFAMQTHLDAMKPELDAIRHASQEGRLLRSLDAVTGSLIHMHVNRMLRDAHRRQELVLYDFLDRIYVSQLARRRQSQPTSPHSS